VIHRLPLKVGGPNEGIPVPPAFEGEGHLTHRFRDFRFGPLDAGVIALKYDRTFWATSCPVRGVPDGGVVVSGPAQVRLPADRHRARMTLFGPVNPLELLPGWGASAGGAPGPCQQTVFPPLAAPSPKSLPRRAGLYFGSVWRPHLQASPPLRATRLVRDPLDVLAAKIRGDQTGEAEAKEDGHRPAGSRGIYLSRLLSASEKIGG